MKKIEVIAWTVEDAILIEEGGADRIELVVELERGGLTPPLELAKTVVNSVNIPVRVMVRDTDESFIYDEETMNSHIEYVKQVKQINPEGIIFGSLTKEGNIDFDQLKSLIDIKGDMKFIFHRAFDELKDNWKEEFEKLSKYNVDTLLTSGTKENAEEGIDILKELVSLKTINILPGKSIGIDNARKIINETNADWIHVGYSVRDENGNIDIDKIKKLKESIND